MRILHMIGSVDPALGGPIEGIIRQSQSGSRHSKEVVSLDRPTDPWVKDFPLPLHAMGARRPKRGILDHYGYAPDLVPWLRANLSRYDAVIVNGLWNFTTMAARLTLPTSGIPYYVFTHGMLDPWFRKRYPAKTALKQIFWTLFDGPLLAKAKNVLFTTEEEAALAVGQFVGHSFAGHVIGYGTSEPPPRTSKQSVAFSTTVPDLRGRPYILFLSRIHPKKGCDDLIHAFARVAELSPDLQLVIAGPDQLGVVAELKRLSEQLGVDKQIHWPGMLKGDEKWGAFYGAEAFILPSHQENFGIVVAESLGCGTPVLISNRVNIWREIAERGAGIVQSDGIEGTELLLRRWLGLTDEDRHLMRAQAKSIFDDKFEISGFIRALDEIIEYNVQSNIYSRTDCDEISVTGPSRRSNK